MIYITIAVDAPPGQAIGIKEHLAMELERFGDTRVIDISTERASQKQGRELKYDCTRCIMKSRDEYGDCTSYRPYDTPSACMCLNYKEEL